MKSARKKITRADQKTQMLAEAERLIEQMLDWTEQTERPNLSQIESIVLELRRQFGKTLAENAVAAQAPFAYRGQAATQPVEAPVCPQCGQAMQSKGAKDKRVVSQVGELQLERTHYYCPTCEDGLFPPR